mgnify:CR=1 FL=1
MHPEKALLTSPNDLIAGGVYLTFSGDYHARYCYVKVIYMSPDTLWLKAYPDTFLQMPQGYDDASLGEPTYFPVSYDAFFAWGPPTFPIFVTTENVTDSEKIMAGMAK